MKHRLQTTASFTLVELMVVVAVIAVLSGLILGGAGAVRQRAVRGQAKTEIAAIEAALGRYQADTGEYPVQTSLFRQNSYDPAPSSYNPAGSLLFSNLWGAATYGATRGGRQYINVKPSMVSTSGTAHFFIDPWGYAYGYYWSGTNSLYGGAVPDVWSTGGGTTATASNKWVTSW